MKFQISWVSDPKRKEWRELETLADLWALRAEMKYDLILGSMLDETPEITVFDDYMS